MYETAFLYPNIFTVPAFSFSACFLGFCFWQIFLKKRMFRKPFRNMFCVFLHCFRSVLVINSAVLLLCLVYHFLNSLVFRQIYHRIDGMLFVASKYGKRQSVMKNKPGDWSQSESAKYFERKINCIISLKSKPFETFFIQSSILT